MGNFTLRFFAFFITFLGINAAVKAQISTIKDGYWDEGSTWSSGISPASHEEATVLHEVTIRTAFTREANTIVYGTIVIADNGWVGGQGLFKYQGGDSRLTFNRNASYDLIPEQKFWPRFNDIPATVTIEKGIVYLKDGDRNINSLILKDTLYTRGEIPSPFESKLTIINKLEIQSNGALNGKSPEYETGSSLVYAMGGNYEVSSEWRKPSEHPSDKAPYNVIIKKKAEVRLVNPNIPRIEEPKHIRGSLTIEKDGSLDMAMGNIEPNISLSVDENVTIAGQFIMGYEFGCDLKLKDTLTFVPGHTFIPNNRAVFFMKNSGNPEEGIVSPQLLRSGGDALTIPYIVLGIPEGKKGRTTGTYLRLEQDLTISAPNGDKAIGFPESADVIDLNGNTLTIGSAEVVANTFIQGDGRFNGSPTSSLILLGSGNTGNLNFVKNDGHGRLNSIVIDKKATDTAAKLGAPLTIHGTGSAFTHGWLDAHDLSITFEPEASYTRDQGYINATHELSKVIKKFSFDKGGENAFTFPVGDGTAYTPADFVFDTEESSGAASIGVNLRPVAHPQINSEQAHLKRHWNVTQSGHFTVEKATFHYVPGDVVGAEADLMTVGYANPNWYVYQAANTATHTLSLIGETQMEKAFTGGKNLTPLGATANSFFRSTGTGGWTTPNRWEWSPTGTGPWFTTSEIYPTRYAKGITIRNGHTVTLKSNTTARRLLIEAGGVLDNDTSTNKQGFPLTIWDDGVFEDDFQVKGEYRLYGKPPVFKANATARVFEDAVVKVNRNRSPEAKSEDFATEESQIIWNHNSIFEWNTSDRFNISGKRYFPNANELIRPIFKVSKSVSISTAPADFWMHGNFLVNAKTTLGGTGKKVFFGNINGSDTLEQGSSSGRFILRSKEASVGGSGLVFLLQSRMYLRDTTVASYPPSIITIPPDSSLTVLGQSLNNNYTESSLHVLGTLDVSEHTIGNLRGQIQILNAGTLRSASPGNKEWPLISVPSGLVNLNPGATIEMYRDGDQIFKSRNDFSNLIFSGSGKKEPSGPFIPKGTVTIQHDAVFDCSGETEGHNVGDSTTNLTMKDNSRLIIVTTGVQPKMAGAYDLQGGTIEFAGNHNSIRSGNYYYYNIEISGDSVNSGAGNVNIKPGGLFRVKPGGAFTINGNSIKGVTAGTAGVIVDSNAVFKVGNKRGFHGYDEATFGDGSLSSIHYNIKDITLHPGSTVEYHRSDSQAITNKGGLVYQNLVLSGKGPKTAPPDSLIIKGNFTRKDSAVFKHNDGLVVFSGTTPQIIDADSSVFFDVLNDNKNELQIKSDFLVKNTLELGGASKMRLSTGDVTIISDSTGTGRVLPISHDNAISYANHTDSGRFKVERFIPNHPKAWQLLSASTKGGTFREAWQNNQSNDTLRGVWLTSPKFVNQSNSFGFDAYSPAPSVKYYNPVTNSYVGVGNTADIISSHPAYFLFVRGDRRVQTVDGTATATTLHTRGKLFAPGKDAPTSITIKPEQWGLLGNPYASAIDVKDLDGPTGWMPEYYVWDPNLTQLAVDGGRSVYGLGAYVKVYYDEFGERKGVPGDFETNYPPLQSGQGFFMFNGGIEDMVITFKESAKTSDTTNVFRTKRSSPIAKIRTNLFVNNNGERVLLDGTLQLFDETYSIETDHQDAKKMMNSTENIALPSARYPLIIERRPFAAEGDTLYYHLTNLSRRNYALQVSLDQMQNGGHEVFFNDSYSKTVTPLEEGKTDIEFTVDQNPASAKKDRFYLTFKKMKPLSLPVQFSHEKAVSREDRIDVSWRAENQELVENYILEHSSDGQSFATLNHVGASSSPSDAYALTHEEPAAGKHFYRIKALLKTGQPVYSKTISAEIRYSAPAVSVYPNPASEVVYLNFFRQAEGKYNIRLINGEGRHVMIRTIIHNGLRKAHQIHLPVLPAGMYRIEIIGPNGQVKNEQILIAPK